ncbi:collagen, type I, alpha 1b-like [Muntiacus reevesi]|uniref:collagen, type I, alpha 1b-like n=1 Tax=Muntiacus reevesi TaxID=9886 RepID=UPI0033071DE0
MACRREMVVLLGVERVCAIIFGQDWDASVSVRPPHKTLPFWRARLAPGGGSASKAPGVRGRLRAPVPPPRTAGPPALASLDSESSPPQPLRWNAGGSKEAGVCFKTPRLETQLLSLNSSSVSPRPAASGLEDARQPAKAQAGNNLAGPAGENPEHSAGSPRAFPRLGAEGEPGRRKGQPAPSSAQLARRPRGEWQRRRARCQRRGAEPRALVGAGSEAGRAGRGRRRGRCWALELRARGEESRAAGAELEEAAATAGSGLETASSGGERLARLSWVRGSSEPCAPEAAGAAWAQQRKEAGRPGRCSSHAAGPGQVRRQMGSVTRASERIGPRRGRQPGVGVLTSR